ncbi:MAG TPA: Mth938-like domain-containing protein [Beijerinckiaceae bacterium]|nr:Mth938-like domain-containing protein [Beijerinckiaceae bacterium]
MTLARSGFAPGIHEIEAYGRGGFRFGGVSHIGSILATPSGIHAWSPRSAREITPEVLEALAADAARIDLLFLGTGRDLVPMSAPVREHLASIGLRFEALPTAAAARTYNVLVREGRRAAAGLIAVD